MTKKIHLNSTQSLKQLLEDVIKSPKDFLDNQLLIDSLTAQGKLAAFEDASRGIKKCSLNTLKERAAREFITGFMELNNKRTSAKLAIKAAQNIKNKPKPDSIDGLKDEKRKLKYELQKVHERNVMMTHFMIQIQRAAEAVVEKPYCEKTKIHYHRELEIIYTKLASVGESDFAVSLREESIDE
jgi:hypothetical protein